jgi:hypothetical protein
LRKVKSSEILMDKPEADDNSTLARPGFNARVNDVPGSESQARSSKLSSANMLAKFSDRMKLIFFGLNYPNSSSFEYVFGVHTFSELNFVQ